MELWIVVALTGQCGDVVLLGTGTPIPDPQRSGPSVAIVADTTTYLVDFGPGVIRQAAAAHAAGIDGLAVRNLDRAFLTHLHSDHTVGYPDLVLTPWVVGREAPLEVFGPEGLSSMTSHLLEAYRNDIHIRLYGPEPANDVGHRVIPHEIQPGVVYEDDRVRVEAFLVQHGTWPSAFGYRFTTRDRVIVVSGDTRPCEALIDAATECDILLHEVYSAQGVADRPPEWRAYHAQFHTSTEELAAIAARAKPGLLVLYHQLFMGVTDEELVAEVRRGYDGDVVSSRDLDVY